MLDAMVAEIFLVLVRLAVSWFVLSRLHSLFQLPARAAIFLAITAAAISRILSNPGSLSGTPLAEQSFRGIEIVVLALMQALYAFVLTAPLGLALELIPLSGRVVDILRGNQLAEQFLPELPEKQSVLEQLGTLVVVYAFFDLGVWRKWLASLLFIPSGSEFSVILSEVHGEFLNSIVRDLQEAFTLGLLIAAPVFVAIAIIELVTIFLARALPRISFTFELLPLKLVASLLLFPAILGTGFEALGELSFVRTLGGKLQKLSSTNNTFDPRTH